MARTTLWGVASQVIVSLVGVAVLVTLFWIGGRDALDQLAKANVLFLVLAFAITFVLTMLTALRWATLTTHLGGGQPISFSTYYRTFIVSRAAGMFVPQGAADFVLRPALHRLATGAGFVGSFSGVVIERFLDVSIVAVVLVPGLLHVFDIVTAAAMWMLMATGAIVWMVSFLLAGPVIAKLMATATNTLLDGLRRMGMAPRRITTIGLATVESLKESSVRPGLLRSIAAMSIGRYALIALQFVTVAVSLDLAGLGASEVAASLPVAQVGTMIAVTPGGLGFLEGGFGGPLELLAVPATAVAAFLLVQRVAISLFLVVLATVTVAAMALLPHRRRPISPQASQQGVSAR